MGTAFLMADSRDWQFAGIHRVDWEEMYGPIIRSYHDVVGPQNGGVEKLDDKKR